MHSTLLLNSYDINAVLVEPIKSISDAYILHSYDTFYDTFETVGHAPKLNIMENGSSRALKRLLQKRKTVF